MARTSMSLFAEKCLPIDGLQEVSAFGAGVYLTVGGLGAAGMVCLYLSPSQLAELRAAIALSGWRRLWRRKRGDGFEA